MHVNAQISTSWTITDQEIQRAIGVFRTNAFNLQREVIKEKTKNKNKNKKNLN